MGYSMNLNKNKFYYFGINDFHNATGFSRNEMECYAITTNINSGITINPKDWLPENPRYIFNLLLSIIRVSVKTVLIVMSMEGLGFGQREEKV